ncbi:hypothetical protein ACFLTI_03360 [Bacteroidota bacterium]
MNKKSTLIYLLNTEESEKCDIINNDDFSENGFNEFEDVFDELNSVKYSPSELIVRNVIQYAHASELIDLGSGIKVEMILN